MTAVRAIKTRTSSSLARVWDELPAYDRDQAQQFARFASQVVGNAQGATAAITEAYIAQIARRPRPNIDRSKVIGAGARNGTDPRDVYERPFIHLWTALKKGHLYDDAVRTARDHLISTAEMDIALTMRGTVRETGQALGTVTGYERVPDANACDFCLMASTQRYYLEDLMPLHNNCNCGVLPLIDTPVIPGQVINRDRYDAVTARLEKSGHAETVHEHGELGPVLADANHNFTAQSDLD